MKTITVEIISSTECRETNPFGTKDKWGRWSGWWPNNGAYGTYEDYKKRAEFAEENRITYKISGHILDRLFKAIEKKVGGRISHINFGKEYSIGSLHQAQVSEDNQSVVIV